MSIVDALPVAVDIHTEDIDQHSPARILTVEFVFKDLSVRVRIFQPLQL